MSKESEKLRPDVNETAFRVMREALGEAAPTLPPADRPDDAKNRLAVKRGTKGGKTRAAGMTKKALTASARKAAKARWGKTG